jgi:hypothetical protein
MNARRHRLSCIALLAIAAVGVLAGCAGGQSGTESGGGKFEPDITHFNPTRITCACALSNQASGIALRGTVVQAQDEAVHIRVDRLIGSEPSLPRELRFSVGQIAGGWASPGCQPETALQPGEDVAMIEVPGPIADIECPEYLACTTQQCFAQPLEELDGERCDADCRQSTRAQCASHAAEARMGGSVLVLRWGRELTIPIGFEHESELQLPSAHVMDLLDASKCNALLEAAMPDGGSGEALGSDVIDGADSDAGADTDDNTTAGGFGFSPSPAD